MKSAEQLGWAITLTGIWGFLLWFAVFLSYAGTPKGQTEGVQGIGATAVVLTGLYVLGFAFRAAYLAGRAGR